MSSSITLGAYTLFPIKDAVSAVPYSRDYISRLAREGKVMSVQVNRQWYIELGSLRKFYEQAQLEELARKTYLSEARRNELDVYEALNGRLAELEVIREKGGVRSVWKALVLITCGCLVGVLVQHVNSTFSPIEMEGLMAQSIGAWSMGDFKTAEVATATPQWYDAPVVIETTSTLNFQDGIVLFPAGTNLDGQAVTELFSDEVMVTMQNATSGVIEFSGVNGTTTLPFLRIPEEAEVVPVSEVTP
jgi:hypothetical protein